MRTVVPHRAKGRMKRARRAEAAGARREIIVDALDTVQLRSTHTGGTATLRTAWNG